MKIKQAANCRWALVSLGEVMLRLDPGEGRVHTTRHLNVWEDGGEYNVARGLRSRRHVNPGVIRRWRLARRSNG